MRGEPVIGRRGVAIGGDDEMTTADDGEEASDCDEPTFAGGCLCPSNLNGRRALNDSAPCASVLSHNTCMPIQTNAAN